MSEKNSSAKPKRFKGWELLVATALCVVVAAVIFFSGFSGFDFGTSGKSASTDDFEAYRKNLESKVKEVVCAIEGAGKVGGGSNLRRHGGKGLRLRNEKPRPQAA